ncbi:MAG: polysaccharide biosynthesis/export family protein [Verrucomicrobiota bacterium]
MQTLLKIFLLAATLGATGCVNVRHGPTFDPRNWNNQEFQDMPVTNAIDPAWLKMTTNEFRLGPGDRVEIELLGTSQLPQPALVGPDGKIYFDLLPGLPVWGLTLTQTRDLLENEMGQYYKKPHVAITLREVRSARIWVLGRLSTPGVYPLNTPMTALDAITRAGGLQTAQFTGTTEELADLRHGFLLRQGRFMPVNFKKLVHDGDMSQNIYLEPDDFIYLPSAQSAEVYVLGAVNEPRAVTSKDQVTLSSAIANARGTIPTAWLREVVIIRGSLTEPHYAVVNFLDILKGRAPEVKLQPRDIVYVPNQPLGMFQSAVKSIVDTFVRTIAANEGLRAGGSATKVGVGVNVGP